MRYNVVEVRFNASERKTSMRICAKNLTKGEADKSAYKKNAGQSLKEGEVYITYLSRPVDERVNNVQNA